MDEIVGAFEVHLTGSDAAALAAFAQAYVKHGVSFRHIVLDQGRCRSQPVLIVSGHGTSKQWYEVMHEWERRLSDVEIYPFRRKIMVSADSPWVPESEDAPATG